MLYTHVQQEEQQETTRELAAVLRLAQQMGQRLANETHGDLYYEVRDLLHDLHEIRAQLDELIPKILPADDLALQTPSSHHGETRSVNISEARPNL
jgi:hypothetical protein